MEKHAIKRCDDICYKKDPVFHFTASLHKFLQHVARRVRL